MASNKASINLQESSVSHGICNTMPEILDIEAKGAEAADRLRAILTACDDLEGRIVSTERTPTMSNTTLQIQEREFKTFDPRHRVCMSMDPSRYSTTI